MELIFQFFSQSGKVFQSLSASKKLSIIVITIVILASIGTFVLYVNQKEYKTLFSNLSTEDAGKIIARLEEKKIFYKISASGDSILVPAENVSKLRLELASSGLPQSGGVGFEIFDRKSFGVTDFVQQVNYQRALQGELSRTINSLDEIQQSRVHIVVPRKSLFIESQAKPEVSVVIKLKPGGRLRVSQVEGIAHLVAASIEGLHPEEVTIIDSRGDILSKPVKGSQMSKQTDSQIEYQRNIEKNLEDRVQSMLEKVAGEGRAVARVSAILDFRVVEKTEEAYDPEEPVVRSHQSKNGETGKTDEIVNYEINRVISKTIMPVGKIESLSVAVLVDDVYTKNDKGVEEVRARSKKEIETLEGLVKGSIGFDAQRGDQVVVTSVSFNKNVLETEFADQSFWNGKSNLVASFIKYFVSLIALILVLLFVIRPLIKFVLTESQMREIAKSEVPAIAGGPTGPEAQGVSLEMAGFGNEGLNEIDVVRTMADQDAQKFAELLRNWLR
jgi:flagellar M-ring protein FliF